MNHNEWFLHLRISGFNWYLSKSIDVDIFCVTIWLMKSSLSVNLLRIDRFALRLYLDLSSSQNMHYEIRQF